MAGKLYTDYDSTQLADMLHRIPIVQWMTLGQRKMELEGGRQEAEGHEWPLAPTPPLYQVVGCHVVATTQSMYLHRGSMQRC